MIQETLRIVASTEESLRRFIAMHEADGYELTGGPNITWWADMRPKLPPPPAPVDWWRTLELTNPKTKIYAARDGIKIYKSVDVLDPKPPPFATATGRNPKRGDDFEVWGAPLLGSEWICVYRALEVLWVSGHDVLAEKPV